MNLRIAIAFVLFSAAVGHFFVNDDETSYHWRAVASLMRPSAEKKAFRPANEKITEITRMADNLETDAIFRQRAHVDAKRAALNDARSKMPYFPSAAQKADVRDLEFEYNSAVQHLTHLQDKRTALLNQIKPLHGIWSVAFYEEQRGAIRDTMRSIHKNSYDNAWWSTLFNADSDSSFADVVIQFFTQWMLSYALMLPFAALYFIVFQTPYVIWQYSSRPSDLVTGLVAWVLSALAFLLPVALFGYGMRELLARYRTRKQKY